MMKNQYIPKSGAWVKIINTIPTDSYVPYMGVFWAKPTDDVEWEGGSTTSGLHSVGFGAHPRSDMSLYNLDPYFSDWERAKQCILNYKNNSKFEMYEEEKEFFVKYPNYWEDYPVEQSVSVVTERGNVKIQPHEYSIVSDKVLKQYIDLTKDRHVTMKFLGKSASLRGKLSEQVFYMRQRGISKVDAIQMCIGSMKTQNMFYLIMHPAYVKMYLRTWEFEFNKALRHYKEYDPDFSSEYLHMITEVA